MKEYSSDLNRFEIPEKNADVRLDQLIRLVKQLNEEVGIEDLTDEDNTANEEQRPSDIVFGKHLHQTNVRKTKMTIHKQTYMNYISI